MSSLIRFVVIALWIASVAVSGAQTLDTLVLGDDASESAHQFSAEGASTVTGALGQTARQLLPQTPASWRGGRLCFVLRVDPERQNYFTLKLSGDDVNENRLMLHIDGKQVGWRHLGEVEPLDTGSTEPAYPGRFFYQTSPLPLALTKGKTEMRFEIVSEGRLWSYGKKFDEYQKPMTTPTRGIYRAYVHVDGCFTPASDDVQGTLPKASVRSGPGEEVLAQVKARVNREIDNLLKPSGRNLTQMQLQLLARAYGVEWTSAYRNPAVIETLINGLDAHFVSYRKNPRLAQEDPATWNPDWFGLGVCGEVLAIRVDELRDRLDSPVKGTEAPEISRREGYAEMLFACREWHRKNRRQYTNQTMLKDLHGIYHANRGLAVVAPERAWREEQARRYLYEAVGIQPWRDSDDGGKRWNVGSNYWQLTAKGLTKELGYVGSYGEVLDLVADIYEATRTAGDQQGDPLIREQLIKIARARSYFRHPAIDADGSRVMRLEQVVGWRDSHYPGYMTYGQRATRDASALQVAAITRDPHLVGFAQQQIADNQFFLSEVQAMNDQAQPLRTTIGRLNSPGYYAAIRALPESPHRLPMSWDQPDTLFSDEEDGVLALKNGDEILYVSLYWRARYGINNLARVHHMTPRFDRLAVVAQRTEFTPHGADYTRVNWTNMAFGNGIRYPQDAASAHAGEVLPIAKVPAEIAFRPGQENVFAGRGDFYVLRYGDYLIGMNMSADKTFELEIPADVRSAKPFGVSGEALRPSERRAVNARTTVVFLLSR